mmetsp:Transcript_59636/g.94376  ORF Transcript_59636/g.94376 Transcript_59636/m.94376 type:complete len:210 (-) Transcript_59636:166-795(-)
MSFGWRTELSKHFLPLLLDATGQQGSCLWLREDDLQVRPCLLHDLAGSLEGATSAIACDPVIQVLALKVLQNLRTCGLGMVLRTRLVLELSGQEPAMLLCQLLSLQNHPSTAQRGWRHHHFGAHHAHDLSSLNGEGGRHGANEVVAALSADHGQSDASVSTGGLYNGASRLQLSLLLSILNDGDGQAVLHRAQGVEKLALYVEVHIGWC